MLLEQLETGLRSTYLRLLESEPLLTRDDAVERLIHAVPQSEIETVSLDLIHSKVKEISSGYTRRGVLSPNWLEQLGLHLHFFLVHARPGWLESLVEEMKAQREGISQYIVYGDADSLIILYGTGQEVERLLKVIERSTHFRPTHFSIRHVLYFYRYPVANLARELPSYDTEAVNQLATDYDAREFSSLRDELLENGILLGPIWAGPNLPRERVIAFVGIRVIGRVDVEGSDILRELQRSPAVSPCLVHLFETDRGQPYPYFAKLVCRDLEELDLATTEIGSIRIGSTLMEGVTFVVATGVDRLPIYRSPNVEGLIETPIVNDLELVALRMLKPLGHRAIIKFNEKTLTYRMIVLRSLAELQEQLTNRGWSDELDRVLRGALDAFSSACLEGPNDPSIRGAVSEIGIAVEAVLKHAVRKAVETVYGKDYGRAQKELHLTTASFRNFTLGRSAAALSTIQKDAQFGFLHEVLSEDWLDRLEGFSRNRNRWSHEGILKTFTGEKRLDEARRVLVDGFELIRWVNKSLLPVIEGAPVSVGQRESKKSKPLVLPDVREGRPHGIFLSHSNKDKEQAGRLALHLRDLGYPIWYDEWAIYPGDSIVQKIEEGLAKSDVLAVLLSPNSVGSRWVRLELNNALVKQLSGQNVRVLPILIEACEVPETLLGIRYANLTKDFNEGFIELLKALNQMRQRD